jgi:hypothetical protein
MRGLKAEIQVRTIAQHIWAAASHDLQYKHEESVPLPVRRAIYRVSALLETVDLEFERVLEQRALYRDDVNVSKTTDTLNVDLLEKVLDSLLPADNKKDDEDYADLLTDFLYFGLDTVPKLQSLIEKHISKILEVDAEIVKGKRKEYLVNETHSERIAKGVYLTHAGLAREALLQEFGEEFNAYQRVNR